MAGEVDAVASLLKLLLDISKGSEKSVHEGIKCNVCTKSEFITGKRFVCLVCANYNMCELCFKSDRKTLFHQLNHPVTQFIYPYNGKIGNLADFNAANSWHTNKDVYCSGCLYQGRPKTEISGVAYKCSKCENFNLCSRCVETKQRVWSWFSKHNIETHPVFAAISESAPKSKDVGPQMVYEKHIGVVCGVCGDKDFSEDRYKCTICENFDLCSTCFQNRKYARSHTSDHPVMPILVPIAVDRNSSLIYKLSDLVQNFDTSIHDFTECNVCKNKKIVGLRFVCQQCPNFDLCYLCYATGNFDGQHRTSHQLLVFSRQYPPLIDSADLKQGDKIGGGGFGEVFKATYKKMHGTVALKVITLPNSMSNKDKKSLQESFMREISGNSYVINNSIVKLYGYCVQASANDTKFKYIMQYMAGGELTNYMKSANSLTFYGKLKMLLSIAQCMKHMHYRGFAHRDLRPSNIVVSRKGDVKVCDLGIARLVDNTNTFTRVGAQKYMPTEFFTGSYNPFKLDIYTFGLTMYEFLVGNHHRLDNGVRKFDEKSPILMDMIQQCVDVEANRPTADHIVRTLAMYLHVFSKQLARRSVSYNALTPERRDKLFLECYPKIKDITNNFLNKQMSSNLCDTDEDIKTTIDAYIESESCEEANKYLQFSYGGSFDSYVDDNVDNTSVVLQQSKASELHRRVSEPANSNVYQKQNGAIYIPLTHSRISCAFCLSINFNEDRYVCTICKNFNICGDCFDICKESETHRNDHPVLFFRLPLTVDEAHVLNSSLVELMKEPDSMVHRNFNCKLCREIINGLRFQCNSCQEYNLCKACYKKKKYNNKHTLSHQIIIFKELYPPRIMYKNIVIDKTPFAQGEFSKLYRATYKPHGFMVACRIINMINANDGKDNQQAFAQFMNEIKVANEIRHSGLVKFFGYINETIQDKRIFGHVIEYMDEGNLCHFVKMHSGTLPYSTKVKYLTLIAISIHGLHCKLYSHNNLKLENILVSSAEKIKICDLSNISCLNISNASSNSNFMDSRQPSSFLTAEINDLQNDIASLGLIINFMITEVPHKFVNGAPKIDKNSPIFQDIINKCINTKSNNCLGTPEVVLTMGFYYFYFQYHVMHEKIDYDNLNLKEKNDLFLEVYSSVMKNKKIEFIDQNLQYLSIRKSFSLKQIEILVSQFCDSNEEGKCTKSSQESSMPSLTMVSEEQVEDLIWSGVTASRTRRS